MAPPGGAGHDRDVARPDRKFGRGAGRQPARGQFYRSDELVGLIHQNVTLFGGLHPGYRAVHADGRFYAGTFTATPAARRLSRAAHFAGAPVPVTARFSPSSGDPAHPLSPVAAMATRFYLPDGTVTDLIGINLPVFPVHTVDQVLELLHAMRDDPETGRPDPGKVRAFVAAHPLVAQVQQIVAQQPAPLSLATTSYRALHAYRFVDAGGDARWARYHWEPEAGASGRPASEMALLPHEALFDELTARLEAGPAAFTLQLQLAGPEDPVDDVSAFWPDDRERVPAGRLELVRPISSEEIGDPVMMHDPTRVTDGIEISPDDEIINVRRGVYLASVAERTGGWRRESAVLSALCPAAGALVAGAPAAPGAADGYCRRHRGSARR